MAIINYAKREINAKIVYYGPGLCGKTTNIRFIHQKLKPDTRGKLLSLATETDRTLFFDFLPVDLGDVKGYVTRFHLYTVPGQVFYNSTRKMVLKGADGIVFVADSQREMLDANLQSLNNLRENLQDEGKDLDDLPMVIQCNKRDLPNAMPMEELDRALNPRKLPIFAACAADGTGVLPTLSSIAKMVLFKLRESVGKPQAEAAEREMGQSYRSLRKDADLFANVPPAPPSVPQPVPQPVAQPVSQPSMAPPPSPPSAPPLPFVLEGSDAGMPQEGSRLLVPVHLRLHGEETTFQLQLRFGLDASGIPRVLVERFERK